MSPVYIHEKHDIGLVRSNTSIVVGLMLATLGGKPAYRTSTERYLKNQYYAGAPDYGALDPQSELPIILDDWRAGYGLEVAASADPGRYYSSIGMDARHRGMLITGWTPTTITKPSTTPSLIPTIVNDEMELTTGWDYSEGQVTRTDVRTYDSSPYSLMIDSDNETIETEQDMTNATWSKGHDYTFTCWVLREHAECVAKIGISDGIAATSWTAATAAIDTWEPLSVTHTMSVNSTRLRLILHNTLAAAERYACFDHCAITSTDTVTVGATVAMANFNDELYATFGTLLARLNDAGTGFVLVADMGTAITDLEPFTDNNLYIALGTSASYYYMSTSELFTLTTGNEKEVEFLCAVHGATPTMYANYSAYQIKSTADPSGAAVWAGSTTVGSSYHNITDLISWKGLLYIMKEDKPFYLDSTPAIQDDLARELESAQSTTSGKNAWVWKNELHIPCGAQALLHTDGTTNSFINPSGYCTNLTDFAGRVFAGAGDEEWNYVVVENASTIEVEVMATRIETIGGTTGRVWHPIAEISLLGCECCHISTKKDKRLWIASDTATDSLYYLPLPTSYGDIINDSNFKADSTDVFLITSGLHGGFKGEDKYWRKATATLGHTYNKDVCFELHYMKLGAGDYSDPADEGWIDVGDFVGSTASMTQSLYFPANAAEDVPVTPMIWLKLVGKTASTALTPELLSLDIRAILKPPSRKIIECAVRCADNILDKDGLRLEGTGAADIRTVLDEARDATVPFTFYDPWGAEHTCIMLPNDPESNLQTDLKNENPEQYYYLRMQEETIA